eukprot:scaffold108495_cov105-Phaeocystis_antarctica.AAC.3
MVARHRLERYMYPFAQCSHRTMIAPVPLLEVYLLTLLHVLAKRVARFGVTEAHHAKVGG